jgi:conjugal transfer pilin signal peptidase TrbI
MTPAHHVFLPKRPRLWSLACWRVLGRELRCRWYVLLPVLAIWTLAYLRLFVDPTPRVPLLFNWTPSLPYRVALLLPFKAVQRGDYVVFAFDGDAKAQYPGLLGQPFFKMIAGVPGDRITVVGRSVSINGIPVGIAKTHAHDRQPLEPIAPTVIPPDRFYVRGTSPDSFDSRYAGAGLIRRAQVIGIVRPIF